MSAAARCFDPQCTDGPPEGDEPRPRWTDDGDLLCRRCATLLEQRLAELPARRDALRAVLGGLQGAVSAGNKPTKGTPPVPLNIAAHDHLTLMQATVVSWVLMVAEERDLRGPDRNDLTVLTGWLLHQLPWLLAHPAVGDLADEVRDLSRVADGLAQTREQWHRLEPACPDCDAYELGRWDGGDVVGCRSCGCQWDDAEYADIVTAALRVGCVTAQEAALILGVTYGTFRNMVADPDVRLRKVGTLDGKAQYAAAEVAALVQAKEAAA